MKVRNWVLKEYRNQTDLFPYLVVGINPDTGQFIPYMNYRFGHRKTAIGYAKELVKQGYRVDVFKDVASSFNIPKKDQK